MTVTALLIILAIIVFILILPFGVKAAYLDEEPYLAARVLCFNIRLLPAKEKKEKPEKKKKPAKPKKEKKKKKKKNEEAGEAEGEAKKKPSVDELLELARIGLDALSSFRRKLTVNSFMLHFVAADEDPYNAAMMFGYVNTALGVMAPLAEKSFNVRQSDVRTAVSFEITEPQIDAELTVTISLGRILAVGLAAGFKFLKYKRSAVARKAAETDTDRAERADERTDKDGTVAAAEPDDGDDIRQPHEDQGDGGC